MSKHAKPGPIFHEDLFVYIFFDEADPPAAEKEKCLE
jgi:hypothetical protein